MPNNNDQTIFDETFGSNDLSSGYLDYRQDQYINYAEERRRMLNKSDQPFTDYMKRAIRVYPKKAGAVAADIFQGVAVESPKQVVGGIMDAGKEVGKTITELADALNVPTILRITNEAGEIDIGLMTGEEMKEAGGEFLSEKLSPAEARTTTGGLIRGVAQFLTGWIPMTRALKGVGPATKTAAWVKSALAGAGVDFAAFDPHEESLSNLIEQFPELQNPITEFLQSDPSDTEIEGRFKKAVEGLGLGVLSDGFFSAMKAMRAARVAKMQSKAAQEEADLIDKLADFPGKGPKAEKVAAGDFQKILKPDMDKPEFEFKERYGMGDKKAAPERALNINQDRLNTTDDVKNLITGVVKKYKKYAGEINEARREVITNKRLEALADDLGMTVDELLAWRRGKAPSAEEALAARQILVASGEDVIDLARIAKTGNDVDMIRFRDALSKHRSIQLVVSGMTAEAGRLLQSFNIMAKSAKEQQRLITDVLETSGGVVGTRKLAAMIEVLGDSPNALKKVNDFAKNVADATTFDMVYEAWINSLLSNPATHIVNMMGNSITMGWSLVDRKVASWVGQAIDEQSIPVGEVSAQMFGLIKGAKMAMEMAWKSFKTGDPQFDAITKLETRKYRSITAKNMNLTGTAGRFADFFGEYVARMPGRFLMAADEFAKTMAYTAEVSGQAYRQAYNKGLRGQSFADELTSIISNPSAHENIHFDAVDFSRYTTFTKELGMSGKGLQQMLAHAPWLRVIMPFVRTPLNIMKYVGEHSVLAPISNNVKAEIAAGGARRDLALAKIATGSVIMAVAADMKMSGLITDRGPTDRTEYKNLLATGWRPYSFKVGDTYIQYDRSDPVGATLGMAADITGIIGKLDESSAWDVTGAAIISVAQNMTNKTYLRGLSNAITALSRSEPDPDRPWKGANAFIKSLGGTIVPAGVAALERQIWPELSAADNVIQTIASRFPFASKSVPPARNLFGEVVNLADGIGLWNMSPIYISRDKKDWVADEIVKQKARIRMPSMIVDGIRLDAYEYDEYIKLYSGMNNQYVKKPLKIALKELIQSPNYQAGTNGPEGTKALRIKSVFETYRAAARRALKEQMQSVGMRIKVKEQQKRINRGVTQ